MQWLDELKKVQGRGEVKRWGKKIETDATMRAELIRALRQRGERVSEASSGKKLVRQWLARSEAAQIRRNPIHVNETFACVWCGYDNPLSSRIRDHCLRCLRSLHLDVVPGDRASDCRSIMHPTSIVLNGGRPRITYQCTGCDHRHQIWAHPGDQIPPSLSIADLPGGISEGSNDGEL